MRQQAHYYPLFGDRVTLIEIAMRAGVSVTSVRDRLRSGFTPEDIVNQGKLRKEDDWDLPLERHKEARQAVKCAHLDGGLTCETVGALMGVSRQAVNQMEERAMRKLRRTFPNVAEHLEAIREREERKRA